MTKVIPCDKCNGLGYFVFEQYGPDYAGATVLRCEVCQGKGTVEALVTNADHIRAMTDEELASFLCSVGPDEMEEDLWLAGDIIPDYDQHKVEDWLKQPYKEES